jgi:RimJ/RimL family protein N-acetyltransferase
MKDGLIQPAQPPEQKRLQGRIVALEPLDPVTHGEALYDGSRGPEAENLYRYMAYGPFSDRASFQCDLAQKAESEDPLYYAIVEKQSGAAMGHAAFLRITPEHRCMEVGSILYVPLFQRTAGATEAMYLMARYAFEDLGYRRYEWKCDAQNAPSRRAAQRLGFAFEGIFFQHMIVKGRNRDTAWYSMLDVEWPERKLAFESWLDPSNFDGAGRQRLALARPGNNNRAARAVAARRMVQPWTG